MEILLITVWLMFSFILGLFSTALTINSIRYKHLEFKMRLGFYFFSIILSFLVGVIIRDI